MGFNCAADKNAFKALKTFPSFAPRGGLDRVYFKGRLKLLKVNRYKKKTVKVASDHLPVVVEFEV